MVTLFPRLGEFMLPRARQSPFLHHLGQGLLCDNQDLQVASPAVVAPSHPRQLGSRHLHTSNSSQRDKRLCALVFIMDALSRHMGRKEQPARLVCLWWKITHAVYCPLSSSHLWQEHHEASAAGAQL